MSWTFAEQLPLHKQRDPVQGEFFSGEDQADALADSLVRESVQNSLDATLNDDGSKVRLRFKLGEVAEGNADLQALFEGLGNHLKACDDRTAGVLGGSCRYLVIEDYNTTGLRGDPNEMHVDTDAARRLGKTPNEFFHFFRAEGRSSKSGATRGSWGVGKYTFPAASRINTFFGLTVRANETPAGPLVIGQAILKNHSVDGKHFVPDGWSAKIDADAQDAPLPFEAGDAECKAILSAFDLRRTVESGLSIVVPYLKEELTFAALIHSIVANYGLAIYGDRVEFELVDSDGTTSLLNRSTIRSRIDELAAKDDLLADLQMADWVYEAEDPDSNTNWIQLERLGGTPAATLPDEILGEAARAKLELVATGAHPFGVKIPVFVADKQKKSEDWVDLLVIFLPAPGVTSHPRFYRDGIRVTKAGQRSRLTGMRSMVIILAPQLIEMLGLAEGPAHNEWSSSAERFKGRYKYGSNWISFIKNAPKEVLRLGRSESHEEDRSLALDYFAIPDAVPGSRKGTGGSNQPANQGTTPGAGFPTPEPNASGYKVQQLKDGFAVTAHGWDTGSIITIQAAYEVRTGSPWSKWRMFDFEFGKDTTLKIELAGVDVIRSDGNEISLRVLKPNAARCAIRGFDTHRDLVVRVRKED